jgi:hypothetical protein
MLSFHSHHFTHTTEPNSETADNVPVEEDDCLGTYEDGAERTLTDEQIAMFRHSELQEMIKKHRIDMENTDDYDADMPHQHIERSLKTNAAVRSTISSANTRSENMPDQSSKDIQPPKKSSTNKKRKRGKQVKQPFYKPEKQDKEQFTHEGDERTFRRICREADELKTDEFELDY